jgi:hypothetical protein
MDWFDDWALTLAVFIPLVGMALVMVVPRAQETAVKAVARQSLPVVHDNRSLSRTAVTTCVLATYAACNICNGRTLYAQVVPVNSACDC